MSDHPCSHDHDHSISTAAAAKTGGKMPVTELDKNNPELFKGKTPGDTSHLRDDHPLKIDRASVKRDDEEEDEGAK